MNAAKFRAELERAKGAWSRSPKRMIFSSVIRATISYLSPGFWITFIMAVLLGIISLFDLERGSFWSDNKPLFNLIVIIQLGILLFIYTKFSYRKMNDPEGFLLPRDKAPKLFDTIDLLRQESGSPAIKRVYLTREFTAAMAVSPGRLLPIIRKRDLLLGFPLFQILSEKELESVIGHELRHARGGAGRAVCYLGWVSSFLDRMREWERDYSMRINPHYVSLVPDSDKIHARRIVIQRGTEFDSDAEAARVTSPGIAGGGLLLFCFWQEWLLREFWPMTLRRALSEDLPPDEIFRDLEETLEQPVPEHEASRILAVLEAEEATNFQVHPSVGERLAALSLPSPAEWEAPQICPPGQRAFNLLPRDIYLEYRQLFSRSWKAANLPAWRGIHANGKERDIRVAELAAMESLTKEESWELLLLRMLEQLPAGKEAMLREWLRNHPEDRNAHWELGLLLSDFRDPASADHLIKGSEGNTERTLDSFRILSEIYEGSGRMEELEALEERRGELGKIAEKAEYERSTVFMKDRFFPHEIPAKELQRIIASLRNFEGMGRAWLVRKQVQHFSDIPAYVLLVEYRTKHSLTTTTDVYDQFARQVATYATLPPETLVVTTHTLFKTPSTNIQATADSLILS